MKILKFTIFLFLACLFSPISIHAQTTSLSIWPPILHTAIQPGKSITQVYRLKNMGDDTTITAEMVAFEPADEFGHIKLLSSELSDVPGFGTSSVPSFFSLQNADLEMPATFPLKAGETQELVLKIRVPDNEPEADHYHTFLFTSNSQGLLGGSGSTTQAVIGANILLTVSQDGQPSRLAKIEEFSTKKFLGLAIIDSLDPIPFTLRVKNTGQAYFKTIGHIDIFNTFNKKAATISLREDNILVNSIRQLVSEGEGEIVWNPVFPLGRYTATAFISPQDSVNTISQTISFWILPYKAILVIVIIAIFYQAAKKKVKPNKTVA